MMVIAAADDGVGFDPPVAGERAAATGHRPPRPALDGRADPDRRRPLEISSQPYQGTQVVLRLPD
jgi:hypothetical protein